MSNLNDQAPTSAPKPFYHDNPRIYAALLQEEFDMLEQGIGTLLNVAPDRSTVDADPYAVNFVARAMESIAADIASHLKGLRRTLGMPEVQS